MVDLEGIEGKMETGIKRREAWEREVNRSLSGINIQDILLNGNRKSSAVKSVYRAANILACLSNGYNTITDIASNCKLNKATVHRILKALIESRLAVQDPVSRRYYVGYLIAQIVSNPFITHEYLITCASGPMEYLAGVTEETVILCIAIGLQYIILREIPSKHGLRVIDGKKGDTHLHAGATSKVMLSQLSDRDLEIALMNMKLEPLTSNTITDKEKLISELKKIRRNRYAISYGERLKGSMCIAAPIDNYVLPAAVGVIGPEGRIKPRRKEFIREVCNAANQISENVEKAIQVITTRKNKRSKDTEKKSS